MALCDHVGPPHTGTKGGNALLPLFRLLPLPRCADGRTTPGFDLWSLPGRKGDTDGREMPLSHPRPLHGGLEPRQPTLLYLGLLQRLMGGIHTRPRREAFRLSGHHERQSALSSRPRGRRALLDASDPLSR
jgi:hypothetical protein